MRTFLYVSDLYSTSKLGKQRRGRCVGVCAGFQVHFAEAFECLRIESITSD